MASAAAATAIRSIGYIIVFVRDMDRSIAFYRDTLGIPVKMASPHWTEFQLEGTTLALHGVEEGWPPAPKPSPDPGAKKGVAQEIVFNAADPLATREALVRRGVTVAAPKMVHEAGDHVGVSCLFEDPDGNLLSAYGLVAKTAWEKRK